MFNELRRDLPPLPSLISDADARTIWLASLAQVLQAMNNPEQQWACLTLVAQDVVAHRYPGLPLNQAYSWLAQQCGLDHVLGQVQADHLKQALKELL